MLVQLRSLQHSNFPNLIDNQGGSRQQNCVDSRNGSSMILLTTLRINNIVSQSGQVGRVVQLTEETVTLEFANGIISDALLPEDLEGVMLTPSLLEQSGFKFTGETNAYQFALDEDVLITVNPHIFGGHSVQLCVKGKWCGKPVQHLHDLQNMHLDLTGEELSTD
jgi:hypothetical protein